jgi:glyoxylase I family protein
MPTKETVVSTAIESSPSSRTVPTASGISHVGLTVRDIVASEAWYSEVLGLVRAFVEPHATGDGYAVVMTRPGTELFVGLEHHPDADSQYFSPRRTGLDHLALQLAAREDVDKWISHFDAVGVEHEAPFDTTEPVPHALVLVRDPDGIPIELFWFGGGDDQ